MEQASKPLRVILFGATGMVGSGVLQSCLEDSQVEAVLAISRSPVSIKHAKLTELRHGDFYDYAAIQSRLAGYTACFFCLGVSSAGKSESEYSRLTYDLTLAAAEAVLKANPGCAFTYVSGQGTKSTEKGRFMWARVKGRLENKLLSMGFQPAVMFRPGAIQPMAGIRSKTRLYQLGYDLMGPLMPWLVRHFPSMATTSQRLGRAMLKAARGEAGKSILESADINQLGA
jgi:uncharacterized protein YbjT (DUF2867 family)